MVRASTLTKGRADSTDEVKVISLEGTYSEKEFREFMTLEEIEELKQKYFSDVTGKDQEQVEIIEEKDGRKIYRTIQWINIQMTTKTTISRKVSIPLNFRQLKLRWKPPKRNWLSWKEI